MVADAHKASSSEAWLSIVVLVTGRPRVPHGVQAIFSAAGESNQESGWAGTNGGRARRAAHVRTTCVPPRRFPKPVEAAFSAGAHWSVDRARSVRRTSYRR